MKKDNDYSVNSVISRMDLITFLNSRESCLEKHGKKRELGKSHQIHAAYNLVNTVVVNNGQQKKPI